MGSSNQIASISSHSIHKWWTKSYNSRLRVRKTTITHAENTRLVPNGKIYPLPKPKPTEKDNPLSRRVPTKKKGRIIKETRNNQEELKRAINSSSTTKKKRGNPWALDFLCLLFYDPTIFSTFFQFFSFLERKINGAKISWITRLASAYHTNWTKVVLHEEP